MRPSRTVLRLLCLFLFCIPSSVVSLWIPVREKFISSDVMSVVRPPSSSSSSSSTTFMSLPLLKRAGTIVNTPILTNTNKTSTTKKTTKSNIVQTSLGPLERSFIDTTVNDPSYYNFVPSLATGIPIYSLFLIIFTLNLSTSISASMNSGSGSKKGG
ncbi:hypothetical protein HMI54_006261 [Coelomomyces lativittatus]|nr:hypothetical protein HMI54_006261 [Coelomomyces lativittatus]